MASSSSYSHDIPTSSSQSWRYDVFLSFRGEDTRNTFVDHLYSELVERLIRTYKDDKTLPRGESIGPSLWKAIEESQIAIIIFSKNYADSSWCLDELTYIMKCRDERGQIVMPIFYHVDPSEVRNQEGEFGRAFAKLEIKNITKAESWRKALVDASNIAGWEPKNIANGHESEGMKKIVDTILDTLFPLNSDVDNDLVGMEIRSQAMKSRLKIGTGGVRMVGIWGVGGGGKTTLASSVYMEISHQFEGHCFVDNIREESSKHDLKYLQEKVLFSFLKREVKVQSVNEGKHMIKRRLCRSNVLILLDDIDHLDQLKALAGSHDWFGDGSRIIITTRDEHLLRTCDEVSPISLLSHVEAVQLFRTHAYRRNKPVEDYEKLSLQVVSYASGLPLALKVLGYFLYDKDKDEWMSTLARLKDIPETEIVEKLKISYDGLKPVEKELFLDIACFFRGMTINDTKEMLEACDFHPIIGIRVLMQKALITISNGKLDMHDLVQEMGHYIVRGEYPYNPEEHSRIWQSGVIDNMHFRNATTSYDKIKAIRYDGNLSHFPKVVSNMKRLRLLYVPNVHYNTLEGPNFLSNELRYVHWPYYPASPLPESFKPTKFGGIELRYSFQKEVWKGCKHLPHLKKLELHHMDNLLSTPDIDGLPCLEKLSVLSCPSLEEIHPSLGNRTSLVNVSVSQCYKLRMFPTITRMEKLETLEISLCPALHKFPDIKTNMDRLTKLSMVNVGIEFFPSSIGERCTRLISLKVVYCNDLEDIKGNFHALKHLKELEFGGFTRHTKLPETSLFNERCCLETLQLWTGTQPSTWGCLGLHHMRHCLRKLDLGWCQFEDGEIPSDIGELSNMEELDLSGNSFSRLRFSLSQLIRLKLLILTDCVNLVELPELPWSIVILFANNCSSLTVIGDGHTNCKCLSQVFLKGNYIIGANRLLLSMLQGDAIVNHSMSLQVHGTEIPEMFTPLLSLDRCTLQLPQNWCNEFSGFLMCAVLKTSVHYPLEITMKHEIGSTGVQKDCFDENEVATWVGYVSFASLRHTTWWDSTSDAVTFSISCSFMDPGLTAFGVRLVPLEAAQVTTDSSEYGHGYRHKFEIKDDSKSALMISLGMWLGRDRPLF